MPTPNPYEAPATDEIVGDASADPFEVARRRLPPLEAVVVGHLVVTVPALVILTAVFGLAYVTLGWTLSSALLLAVAFGWPWWSFTVPRWRLWAHARGADPERVQRLAVATGLVWPRGWIFEKTELPSSRRPERVKIDVSLPYPPTPEYAPRHAEMAVRAAREASGVELDFSPESLQLVDALVARFREDGLVPERIAEAVFTLGCYVGEVLIEQLGGRWVIAAESAAPADVTLGDPMSLIVEFGDGFVLNPVSKVHRLLSDGPSESVHAFYEVVAAPAVDGDAST